MPEYAAPLAISAITGLGFFGYKLALETAAELAEWAAISTC